jgi:hypothetical protein
MSRHGFAHPLVVRPIKFVLLVVGVLAVGSSVAFGQGLLYTRPPAVGGVSVNSEGVLTNAGVDETGRLVRLMKESLAPVPAELGKPTDMRKISLRKLEEAMRALIQQGKPLPEEMHCLAGLQEIRYVFVDTEHKDIILAGPGEGWVVNKKGAVVGSETGRPVMLLDDLLVALRTARAARRDVISCSIDPRPEGIAGLRNFVMSINSAAGNVRQTMAKMEKIVGPQKVTITVVPDTSHFARVMVAADYRMKRLGMNLDRSPVKGLPSYLAMLKAAGGQTNDLFPRWWLEPRYESVLRSPDSLAWELRGGSVKTMTEADFFGTAGQRQATVEANPLAQEWADLFTKKYDELAVADPVFGQLRNVMQMAIVSALVVKEDLTGKAGYSMPLLLDPTEMEVAKFPAPKQIDTLASGLKMGNAWIVSTSGGVSINSYAAIKDVKENATLSALSNKAAGTESTNWWWN